MTVLMAHDGALWAGFNCGGVARFGGRGFHVYSEKDGLLNSCVWSLAEDVHHDLWIGTWGGGVFQFHDGKFIQYGMDQGLSGNIVQGVTAARDGSIWVALSTGICQIHDGKVRNYTKADGLSASSYSRVFQDRLGGIWAQTWTAGTDRLVGDRFERVTLPEGMKIETVWEDAAGARYFTGVSPGEQPAIYGVANNQAVQVASGLEVYETRETRQGDLWTSADVGLLRFPAGALSHPHPDDDPMDYEAFGLSDGLSEMQASSGYPALTVTPDGRLWLATTRGLVVLDEHHTMPTDRKPAIHLEQITVGRNQREPTPELVLPAGTHHLELNFDAIEITSPEKIRMQYRLDDVDSEWLNAKLPGHAVHSTLPPGKHSFHIRACNRSGIWDRVGIVYPIIQQPYFYQTRWFLIACIAFGLLLLATLYWLRVRQVVAGVNVRFEERLAERTRIARDLHDTLLQSFQGLMLRLQLVEDLLPEGKAKTQLEQSLQRADQAIAEGRRAVYDLRSSTAAPTDLAQALRTLGDEFATENSAAFHLVVEGEARDLNPIIRDELYLITREALRNAFTHARAHHIEAEITYGERAFQLRIRDDGEGIPMQILEEGRPGHYGLSGMRERAKQIGGKLELWSRAGAGTEIDLSISGSLAYRTSAAHPLFSLFSRSEEKQADL
jgi:two-component sensor histidine kinase